MTYMVNNMTPSETEIFRKTLEVVPGQTTYEPKESVLGQEASLGSPYKAEVETPEHYKFLGKQVIDFIESNCTPEEFRGYLKGNILKYRLRAGKKDATEKDILKAIQYEKFFKTFDQEETSRYNIVV